MYLFTMNLNVCLVYMYVYKNSDAYDDDIDAFDEKLNNTKRYIQICLLEQGLISNLA